MVEITQVEQINELVSFNSPYFIKPLMSIEGAKSDILVCNDLDELKQKVGNVLCHVPRVFVQQYIEKDYELAILGCAKQNGECLIPAKEIKMTIYPTRTGLSCKAIMKEFEDESMADAIKTLIKTIGYVGLFSVELMHCIHDSQYYFTEINLRNDGAQPFFRKYGVNFPLIHISDMKRKNLTANKEASWSIPT